MGGRKSETCWAINKRQDNKLKNFCIWLVIYLNCTMMHGLQTLNLANLRNLRLPPRRNWLCSSFGLWQARLLTALAFGPMTTTLSLTGRFYELMSSNHIQAPHNINTQLHNLESFLFLSSLRMASKRYPETSYPSYNTTPLYIPKQLHQ